MSFYTSRKIGEKYALFAHPIIEKNMKINKSVEISIGYFVFVLLET